MSDAGWIRPGKMSLAVLEKVLRDSSLELCDAGEDVLAVPFEIPGGKAGLKVFLLLDEPGMLIRYHVPLYLVEDEAPLQAKLKLVNRLNEHVVLLRFSLPAGVSDMIQADYDLSYECGVAAGQIVDALGRIPALTLDALRACDEEKMVFFSVYL